MKDKAEYKITEHNNSEAGGEDNEKIKSPLPHKFKTRGNYKRQEYEVNSNKSGLVITNNSVYEYDMECLKKNRNCY